MEKLNYIQQNPNSQKKCSKHISYQLDLILIQKGVENNLICFKCFKDQKINPSQIMHVQEIQNISNENIIQNFPPLEDENLTEFLNGLNDLNLKELTLKINDYFDKLKTQLIETIDKLKNEAKLKIQKIADFEEQILDVYDEISSKYDLKNLLNSNQENTHEMMKKIIDDKFNNISANTLKIKEKIENYKKVIGKNSFDISPKIQDHVTCMLNKIDFFSHIDQNIFNQHAEKLTNYLNSSSIEQQIQHNQIKNIHSINFIKSSFYADSQNQNITRGINNEIQIQKAIQFNYAVLYTDFILDPKKKYIFRIQIQTNNQENAFINIGLIEEQNKNTLDLYNNGLIYIERGDNCGIFKSIKGGNVFEGSKKNINKEIEMRINLENKILKVGTYPNYQNVAEVEDKTKIEDNQQYRLATELFYLEHKIIITHFEIPDNFDDKM